MLMVNGLKRVYEDLDFKSGELFVAAEAPGSISNKIWLEKGEWLAAAKRAGADSVFFVGNNPVVIFAECVSDQVERIKTFNRIWSLSRPRLLFLYSPGEIAVYDLAQKPINLSVKDKNKEELDALLILKDISLIAKKMQIYHRDNIESGKVFEQGRFGDLRNRADKALIKDLKIVRYELIKKGLSGDRLKYAHALIGRSIFIRYLEDRGILTEEYFNKVACKKAGWANILKEASNYSKYDFSKRKSFYGQVLSNKEFTYALFRSLGNDFNGDMFPDVEQEQMVVEQEHLSLLQGLLYGDTGLQRKLFFYSYQFDVIPLDLISSIYDEFYYSSIDNKKDRSHQDGAFYTPSVLAEFVLSRILTEKELRKNPRVLDPACGSGIFLVEAFRRIVRYQIIKKKNSLTFNELKKILKNQIAGIEINEEAARITAFSLCLSMLHYLEPPSIQRQIKKGNQLPKLLVSKSHSSEHYNCILVGNAFDESVFADNVLLAQKFGNECTDIIVGNPPWGAVTKSREQAMLKWCRINNKQVGDKEQSQAFILRVLDFLKKNGKAGMLVSAGVLFKHSNNTQLFRKEWLTDARLREIYNFTHVRTFFFNGAISPFLMVNFEKAKQANHPVLYASAKQTAMLDKTQAVLFSKYDFNWIQNSDLSSSKLWKSYWFGRALDNVFLSELSVSKNPLLSFINRNASGQGLVLSPEKYSTEQLGFNKYLEPSSFDRYSDNSNFVFKQLPRKIYRLGQKVIFSGKRILVKRGIDEASFPKGQLVARYESSPFCFTNAINGLKLQEPAEWKYKTILGILWSSFSRYFYFMTASNWGLWHHEIHLDDELLQIPVVFDERNPATKVIVSIVDELRNYHPIKLDILNHNAVSSETIEANRRRLETKLDEAVFKLYELNDEQKDLIRDCCEVTLPLFYRPLDSVGSQQAVRNNDLSWIERYVNIFTRRWNVYLDGNEEMHAIIYIGAHENIVALEFYPVNKGRKRKLELSDESLKGILDQIGVYLPQPMGVSQIILDGLIYVVSKSGIIMVKRNEKRFWTRSLAREDADTTLAKVMLKGMPQEGKR